MIRTLLATAWLALLSPVVVTQDGGFSSAELHALALKARGDYARATDAFFGLIEPAGTDPSSAARAEYHVALAAAVAARCGRYSTHERFAALATGDAAGRNPGLRDRCLHAALTLARLAGDAAAARAYTRELGYLRAWTIVGPFDNERGSGLVRAEPPETELDLDATYDGKKRPVQWRRTPVPDPIGGLVDFDAMLRPNDQVLAYAAVALVAERQTGALLWFGSDEAVKVFVNGDAVFSRDASRKFRPDQDVVGIMLEPGPNLLVFKVCDEEGAFEFAARLRASNGSPLTGVTESDDPVVLRAASRVRRGEAPMPALPCTYGARHFFETQDAISGANLVRHGMLLALDEPDDVTERRDHAIALRAVAQLPDDPTARYLLAFTRVRSGRAEERDENARRQDYEALLTSHPDHCEALRSLAELDLADANTPTRAIESLRRALAVNPDFAAARVLLSDALRKLALEPLADLELRRASESGPGRSPQAAQAWFTRLRALGEARAAVQWLDACEAAGHPRTIAASATEIAEVLASIGRRDEALALLRATVAVQPCDRAAWQTMATLHEAAESYDDAIDVVSSWLRICPEDDDALVRMAHLHGLLDDVAKQREFLRTALELDPNRKRDQRHLEFLLADESPFYAAFEIDASTAVRDASTTPADATEENDALFYLLRHDVVRAYRNGTTSRYHHQVVRVLSEQGARDLATFSVPYYWGEQRGRLLEVRVVKQDGTEQRPRLRGTFVRLPPLTPGDVCEFRYRVDDVAPTFFGDYFGLVHEFAAPDGSPTLRSVLDVVLDPGRDYSLQTENGAPDPTTSSGERGTTVHHFEMSDLQRRVPEELRPKLSETEPLVRITTYRDWDHFASWWAALIRKQTEVTREMQLKVAELTEGLQSDEEKIDAIYRFVTTDIQYKAWEFGVHGYQPYSTAVIFERRHGDCKDKAILMNAMLAEVGIDAHPVLIFADPRRSADDLSLAMVQHFNHCISYVPPTDGRAGRFLDGTAVYHPSDTLPEMDQGATVLVVRDGGGEIRNIGWTNARDNLDERTFEVRLDADGSAFVTMFHEPRRSHAVAVRESLGNEPAKRREILERELSAVFGSVEIVSVETSDLDDLSEPVRVEVAFRCRELATVHDGELVLEPGFADEKLSSITSKAEREFALLLGAPWTSRQHVVYRLPEGYSAGDVPEPVELAPRFGSFASRWTRRTDGAIEIERQLSIEQHRIEPQEYPEFREFATDVGRADRRVVIVRRNP